MRRTCPFGAISKRSRQKAATGRRDAARTETRVTGESAIVEQRDRFPTQTSTSMRQKASHVAPGSSLERTQPRLHSGTVNSSAARPSAHAACAVRNAVRICGSHPTRSSIGKCPARETMSNVALSTVSRSVCAIARLSLSSYSPTKTWQRAASPPRRPTASPAPTDGGGETKRPALSCSMPRTCCSIGVGKPCGQR
jgi:hypothetical protein